MVQQKLLQIKETPPGLEQELGEDPWCAQGRLPTPVWQRGGNESRIQPQRDPNAPVLRCAQGQHHSESLAPCELPPPQGRNTPEPAPQHPQTKVGDALWSPNHRRQPLGCSWSRCVPAPPFTLSSAAAVNATLGHEQRAPSAARLINEAQLIPRSYTESSGSTSHQHRAGRTPQAWGLPGGSQPNCHHREPLSMAAPSHQNPPSHQNHASEPEAPEDP